MSKDTPLIYTPDNEPYLGRASVRVFDEIIQSCMKVNSLVAPHTHQIKLTDLQLAACQIIPAAISLSLSIRELVRQGYLYGALVLMRPLVERTMIILYLHSFPDAVGIWKKGWPYGERPTLSAMFNRIGADRFPSRGPEITRSLNSLTHGDPASAMWNLVETREGEIGHGVSKILDRPDLCDHVCGDAIAWIAVLVGMMHAVFPGAFSSQPLTVAP